MILGSVERALAVSRYSLKPDDARSANEISSNYYATVEQKTRGGGEKNLEWLTAREGVAEHIAIGEFKRAPGSQAPSQSGNLHA